MIRQWLEELVDTLLYLVLIIGLLIFFICFWRDSYQVRCAEKITNDFLYEISAKGGISLEKYEGFINNLFRINADYEIELGYAEYGLRPIYACVPTEQLMQYYLSRNIRKEMEFSCYEVNVVQEAQNRLRLQQETNATILAAEEKLYLPLPEEETVLSVEAVRKYQEVYEGEELITLCLVSSEEGYYYVEAEPCYGVASGQILLEPMVEGENYSVPVEVICYPRVVTCVNGHEVVNTATVLDNILQSGKVDCPYCELLPAYVVCNTEVLMKKSGTKLTKEEVWLNVKYLNGNTEIITPESLDWQDNYDENYCGLQRVTISYRGENTTITVITENDVCSNCDKSCNGRSYEDYIAFPYCVACMSEALLFTGEVYEEEQIHSHNELLALLDAEGAIVLQAGGYVTIRLSKKGVTKVLLQQKIKRDGGRK